MENSSGQGATASVPAEINKWNWGAFLLTWIWGIGNNTFVALLMFVPFVNLVVPFVLGAKGSSWAWRNKKWESVEKFKAVQRKWAKWSLIVYALMAAATIGFFFIIATSYTGLFSIATSYTGLFKLAVAKLEASPEASQVLGKPISTDISLSKVNINISDSGEQTSLSFNATGPKSKSRVNINISDSGEQASLSFNATGPKGQGTVFMEATKNLGQWQINRLVLQPGDSSRRINLNP